MQRPSFQLRPSRYLAVLLLLIHGGAIMSLLLINMLWWWALISSVAVLISFVLTFRRYVLLHSRVSIVKIWLEEQGGWRLKLHDGMVLSASLRGDSTVTTFMLILNFKLKDQSKTYTSVICRDSVDPESFRRLCVWLSVRKI